ncbi:hypothetical protein [Methanobrevibacter sp. V14]|uniref:hypothetical protein n=1 Tax=Methanobrevibacter sp. V14 TaxID=3064280 RepID=UPI0027361FC4|nr:hypothetical protein [Methanobrevibacter sp. V14]
MNKQIQIQIDHTISQIPTPEKITLVKVYDDNHYADVKTDKDEVIEYIPIIGGRKIGNTGILLYLNNDYTQPIAIIDTI